MLGAVRHLVPNARFTISSGDVVERGYIPASFLVEFADDTLRCELAP